MSDIRYKQAIDLAFELNQQGKNEESVAALSTIYKDIPADDIGSLGIVGSLFREANELDKGLYCFQKAFEVDPNNPRVSLGLFHSLWRLERYDEALDELKRFLSVSESEEHNRVLSEMEEGFFGDTGEKFSNPNLLIEAMRKELRD
jgi:tetratricopeptide (TPR) repeat protein